MRSGKIYLIPSPIAENTQNKVTNRQIFDILVQLKIFFAENLRTARRYLSSLHLKIKISELDFFLLDKNTDEQTLLDYLNMIRKGDDVGIISEAGCPGIADPGSNLVSKAHRADIQVIPLNGPSSIFLALMGSGFNGQMFTFHGYLPIDKKERVRRIRQLETELLRSGYTQIFMETPYRNTKMISDLLETLNPDTLLCIASNITGEHEFIATKETRYWKTNVPQLHKMPTVYLLGQ